jgi:hypothetical protein
VNEYVEAAQAGLSFADNALDFVGSRDVANQSDALATRRRNGLSNGGRRFVVVPAVDDHVATLPSQIDGDCPADTLRSTGHQCPLAREIHAFFAPGTAFQLRVLGTIAESNDRGGRNGIPVPLPVLEIESTGKASGTR